MAISEETRYQLRRRLDAVLGVDEAGTLMAHLPPVGWADVATRHDVDHAATVLRSELEVGLAEVRTELATGLAAVRTELSRELGTGLSEVRAELRESIGSLRSQQQALFFGLVGLQVSAAGIAVAVSQLS
jgi:hypothetical protein